MDGTWGYSDPAALSMPFPLRGQRCPASPTQLTHRKPRELAYQVAWIATATEAANDLEDLLSDVPPEKRVLPIYSSPWPWELDSFRRAQRRNRHAGRRPAKSQGGGRHVVRSGTGDLTGASSDGDRSWYGNGWRLVCGHPSVAAHAGHQRDHRARGVRPLCSPADTLTH